MTKLKLNKLENAIYLEALKENEWTLDKFDLMQCNFRIEDLNLSKYDFDSDLINELLKKEGVQIEYLGLDAWLRDGRFIVYKVNDFNELERIIHDKVVCKIDMIESLDVKGYIFSFEIHRIDYYDMQFDSDLINQSLEKYGYEIEYDGENYNFDGVFTLSKNIDEDDDE